ncbi:hypothetical protein ACH5RR_018283 [Cinchona calisaya]|uniref:Uncharacterized protein n=1 Tax=Cinchona calisaya TaxID=153742 RepID=A0ABD2ZLK0_9GENT
MQLMAELIGTYLLMFTGFTSIVVNLKMDKIITFPGVAMLWGLDVMLMVYTVGHISGAHFNPAVNIAFATYKRFAWKRTRELAGLSVSATVTVNSLVFRYQIIPSTLISA